MSLIVGEKKKAVRMFKLGLRAPEITRRILDTRSCGGYAETLLEIERISRKNELTEVDVVATEQWKESGEYTTFEIAAKILVSRYQCEYREIIEAVKDV